jgi:hypothetical protein
MLLLFSKVQCPIVISEREGCGRDNPEHTTVRFALSKQESHQRSIDTNNHDVERPYHLDESVSDG